MQGLRFHHVGLVIRDIDAVREYYCGALGYLVEGPVEFDPIQKVRVQFLRLGGFVLELIEPADPGSPVSVFLQKGGGLQHVCYECDDIEGQVRRLQGQGAGLACAPVAAVAMQGKRVAFLVNKQRQLIELVEA